MSKFLKDYLIEKFGLAADADDATAKALASDKVKTGELSLDKYTELLNQKEESPKDKAAELASLVAKGVSESLKGNFEILGSGIGDLTKGIGDLVGHLKGSVEKKDDIPPANEPSAEEQEKALKDRIAKENGGLQQKGNANDLWSDGFESDQGKGSLRVKEHVERWADTKTALTYKSEHSKRMGVYQKSMQVNGIEVNEQTERSKNLAAVWLKLQTCPEHMKEWENDVVKWILHKEKFIVPGCPYPRYLTESERQAVWNHNKNFYTNGRTKAVIDDSTSGGENAIPEFFDYDLIVTPTLAAENLLSYCNVVMVPRGVAAQNFTMGRPTFAAATAEGTGNEVSLFTTTSFIANHDTPFFRAAGFTELGMNFLEDANPRILAEIQNQYRETSGLWFNEQITNGDGSTEPQGIKNDSGTTDVTPASPTTGGPTIGDYVELYFGVNKAFRLKGGLQNACYIMTDTTYSRARSIATGVTGDTRLVFGHTIGDYMLFNQPVLIEENGMGNNDAIFCQMKAYRMHLRQGLRFIREDRGDQLVRANSMLIGADVRAGGQLDLPGYAAVLDSFQP